MNAKKIIAAILAVAAGAVISAFAGVPQLTATISGNDVSVTVPAGVLDDTSVLYLVWDEVDHGEKLADWPTANRIAYDGSPAVSSSAATYTLSKAGVQNGAYMRVIATSNVRLIGGYVALKANQYINTGIKDTEAYGLDIRYRPLGTSSGKWSSLMGGVRDKFTIGMYSSNYDKYYVRYSGGTEVGKPAYTLPDTSSAHTVRIYNQVLSIDGEPSSTPNPIPSGSMGVANVDILLGVTWNDSEGTLNGEYCHAEWYYATLLKSDGDALVNLVPALCGGTTSREAVFYDTVSGECFANAGTGTLDYSGNPTNTVAVAAAATDSLCNGRVAVWTGNGNPKDATDANNWSVTNVGIPVPDAIPGNGTKIASCTLAADADWSALASTDTRALPVEYVDVGEGVYVDTGIYPGNNTRVVMDVTVQSPNEYWFGAWNNSYKSGAYAVGNDGTGVYVGYGNNGGTNVKPALSNGRYELDFSDGELKVNGDVKYTMPAQTFNVNYTLFLFGQDRGNKNPHLYQQSAQNIRFHSCQIYTNNTLVCDYVPVTVGGVAKIYDRKNNAIVEFLKVNGTEVVNAGAVSGGPLGGDCVEIDGNIDLKGHKLTVGYLAGTGTVTDSVGGGELHVSVPVGLVVENVGVTLAGSLKLVKDGAGTFVGAKADQTYTGGTVATAGWLKQGAYSGSWGPHKSLITICKDENADTGAGFDWNGMANNQSTTAYSFKIAGTGPDGDAAMKTSVLFGRNNWNANYIADMELDGDATVKACLTYQNVYGFEYLNAYGHNLVMNGYTLTVAAGDSFAFRGVTVTGGGTIVSVPDTSSDRGMRRLSFYGAASDLSTTTLDVHDMCGLNLEKDVTVKDFIDRRTLQWNDGTKTNNKVADYPDSTDGMLFVIGRFQPHSTNLWSRVTLGDATHLSPTLALGDVTGTYTCNGCTLSYASGATVTVNLSGTRTDLPAIARTKDEGGNSAGYVLTWAAKPENVEFVLDAASKKDGYKLTANDTGLLLTRHSGTIISFY